PPQIHTLSLHDALPIFAFLDDPELDAAAERAIAAGKSAGFAWRTAIEQFVAPMRAAGDRRFAERIDDLRDLERRVLAALAGEEADRKSTRLNSSHVKIS